MRMKKGTFQVSGLNDTITDCTDQPTETTVLPCPSAPGTRAWDGGAATRAFLLSDDQVQQNQLPPTATHSSSPHERAHALQRAKHCSQQ